ncbi:MAG: hypothetical protein QM775_11560 [Pirellulales bacterium]
MLSIGKCEPVLDKAFAWLERNFSVVRNPGTKFFHTYYLYSVERIGRITGRRFVGAHDWYREGTTFLLATQELSGAWPSDLDDQEHEADPCIATSFALMFLAKGRRPVVMGEAVFGAREEPAHSAGRRELGGSCRARLGT